MDDNYNTEFTTPYDIFQDTIFRQEIRVMNVFSVANIHNPITALEGLKISTDFNYLTVKLPEIDILVIPSSEPHLDPDLKDKARVVFVKNTDKKAQFMTSYCDGTHILTQAEALDGKVPTTFPSGIPMMKTIFPNRDV